MKQTKRQKAIASLVDREKEYSVADAVACLDQLPRLKFTESLDLIVRLGIDARKTDQSIRGVAGLPAGSGKSIRIAVFASGDSAQEAKDAGAEHVGLEDLIEQVEARTLEVDVVIAHPEAMPKLAKVARILGPAGLMPNPKTGTVTDQIGQAVQNAMAGQARFRSDRYGIVHCAIGRVGFSAEQVEKNLRAVYGEILRLKPASTKGIYIRKVQLSSTMGPALTVSKSELEA